MHTQILTLGAQTWADLDRQGIWRGEQFIPLPARAYQILLCLLRYPNHLLPEARLLQAGWPGELRTSADLFAQIYRIRRALEPNPHHPQYLMTRRNAGYLLNVDPDLVASWPAITSA